MARRTILTSKQRDVLFGFPTDNMRLLKHYTLSDEDIANTNQRRRPRNRLGFALQLCALRYPGRALLPEELIPAKITRFFAAQLGLRDADLDDYAAREETRHEHMAALRKIYGYRSLSGLGVRHMQTWLEDQAELAISNEDIATVSSRSVAGPGRSCRLSPPSNGFVLTPSSWPSAGSRRGSPIA